MLSKVGEALSARQAREYWLAALCSTSQRSQSAEGSRANFSPLNASYSGAVRTIQGTLLSDLNFPAIFSVLRPLHSVGAQRIQRPFQIDPAPARRVSEYEVLRTAQSLLGASCAGGDVMPLAFYASTIECAET